MFVAQLIVNAVHHLLGILIVSAAECDFAARIIRLRKFRRDVEGGPAELRRIDSIVHEGSREIDLTVGVACRRSDGGEVSRKHRRCRNVSLGVCRVPAESRSLVAREEEQLVLYDRAANRSAELIALQGAPDLFPIRAYTSKIRGRIEKVIPDEFEKVAVKLIGSRLRYCADGGSSSVLGGETAGLHFEFLQRIREGKRHRLAIIGVDV